MKQTLNGYIDNPMGKGSVMSQKELIQKSYEQKYGQVMLKEQGKFQCYLFTPTVKGEYYIHIRIPSESTEKIYYDVVIQFYPGSNEVKSESHLRNYFVRFYSNDPAFVFTYANAFKSQDLFITNLSDKMSRLAMRKSAEIRNPSSNIGYVKSIYFAFLYIKDHSLFNKSLYDAGIKFNMQALKSNVMHSDDKMKESNEIRAKARKDKKEAKLAKQRASEEKRVSGKGMSKRTSSISKTKMTNKVGYTKKSKKSY
jgi:hypothetical protein